MALEITQPSRWQLTRKCLLWYGGENGVICMMSEKYLVAIWKTKSIISYSVKDGLSIQFHLPGRNYSTFSCSWHVFLVQLMHAKSVVKYRHFFTEFLGRINRGSSLYQRRRIYLLYFLWSALKVREESHLRQRRSLGQTSRRDFEQNESWWVIDIIQSADECDDGSPSLRMIRLHSWTS